MYTEPGAKFRTRQFIIRFGIHFITRSECDTSQAAPGESIFQDSCTRLREREVTADARAIFIESLYDVSYQLLRVIECRVHVHGYR